MKLEVGSDKRVFDEVKNQTGVISASLTYGTYDLHLEVKFDEVTEIDSFVFDILRKIPSVKETITVIASQVYSSGQ